MKSLNGITYFRSVVCASVFPPFVLCRWKEEFYIDTTLRYSLHSNNHPLDCCSLRSLDNPTSWHCYSSKAPKHRHAPGVPFWLWWSSPPWDISLRLLFGSTDHLNLLFPPALEIHSICCRFIWQLSATFYRLLDSGFICLIGQCPSCLAMSVGTLKRNGKA